MKEFDENEAIRYMRDTLSESESKNYDDDQLLNLLDMIWDYYEQNGLLDVDCDEDDSDIETLVTEIEDYARRMLKKDSGANIQPEHLRKLIEAEMEYEDSIAGDSLL